nr:unnamed protein product [Digitaria exilis]CAB3457808.1 unnamed protein product [Digitaria exilis]
MSSTQPVPETDSSEFPDLNLGLQTCHWLDKKFIPVISGKTVLLVDQVLSEEGHVVTYLDCEEELCAHGRPTTVPIVDVASLHDELARHQMLSGSQVETWHGLAHQGPSLQRAQMRLKQLRKLRRGL